MSEPSPARVGVVPSPAFEQRRRLFTALEAAFPVRFEGRGSDQGQRDLDGLVEIGGDGAATAAAGAGVPSLALLGVEPEHPAAPVVQELSGAAQLDSRLRGAALPDSRLGPRMGATPAPPERATVLATCGGAPTWVRAGRWQRALLAPVELAAGEALRYRLCRERSAALLPLVHLLRELTRSRRWQPPPARATFLFDDPNLHWPSYGFLDLRTLGEHARTHGYHASLATVPLDTWFAHQGALRALSQSRGAISIAVHGNDHDGGELGAVASEAEAVPLAAQALRRIDAFERRTGAPVDRVMVPPHERCSEAALGGLLRCGFEAISMTLPFPWLAQPPHAWLTRPAGVDALVGWRPADFIRGLPLLLRHPLADRSPAELALRAFLDQPLILYGHHDDLPDGLDVLAAAAREVEGIGPARWCSLAEIAANAYETRRDGALLGVRLLSNRVRVDVPATVGRIAVDLPPSHDGPPRPRLTVAGRPAAIGEPIEVEPGTEVAIELRPENAVDVSSIPPPRPRPLAVARRVASEGRDRLAPLTSRVRLSPLSR